MNVYIWRHNRKFHSWSMMNEPCVNQSLYTDAIAIIAAESPAQALELLGNGPNGWLVEEMRRISPTVIPLNNPAVLYADVRND